MIVLPWSNEELRALRDAYAAGLGPSQIAKSINRSTSAIRNKAYELGITQNGGWTDAEIALLIELYQDAGDGPIDVAPLAERLGRTKAAVFLKASRLGLCNNMRRLVEERQDRRKFKGDDAALKQDMSRRAKEYIAKNGQTRGMKGKRHTQETKDRLAKASAQTWESRTAKERQEWIDKCARARSGPPKVARGTWKAGWREIGGKRNYYRSRWEANYARYLEWLRARGEIADWQHEPEIFWFDAIKRGVRSYKPDFRVWESDGSSKLHEVKGWMDARSKTTLKRMAKYHPKETIVIVREKEYNAIARTVGPMIEGWEASERAGRY